MTVFRNSSEKDQQSAVQIINRKFPILVQKKCRPKPEVNKLTVVLKGVSCYSSSSLMRGSQRAVPDPSLQAVETLGNTMKRNVSCEGETGRLVTRTANEKVEQSHTAGKQQGGIQRFVLKSRRLGQAVNPLKSTRGDDVVSQTKPSDLDQEPRSQGTPGDGHCAVHRNKGAISTQGNKPVSEEPLDSLAAACSVLEGHKICFNPKRKKFIVNSGALSNYHEGWRRLPCKQGDSRLRRKQTEQFKPSSTGELAGQEASKGIRMTEQRINESCTVIVCKDAKRDSGSTCMTSTGDSALDELAKKSKPMSLKNVKCRNEKSATQLVSLCNVGRGKTSNGGFSSLDFTQSNQLGNRIEQERCKPGRAKQEGESQTLRFYPPSHWHETSNTSHDRVELLKLPQCVEHKSSSFTVNRGKPSNTAPRLSPVPERRDAIHLPKVDTYEISPRSILDSKYCPVLSEDKGRKHLRFNSSGKWSHKNKQSLVSRRSLFNEKRRIAIRQPSPVSGTKVAVQDPEDVLVNTVLNAVEKCNIPRETEDIPPPVKKLLIRLPPVC